MTGYKRGDIVLVPFPFTDFSTLKQRPALVISSNTFNNSREDVILVAITSQSGSAFKGNNYPIRGAEQKHSGLLREGETLGDVKLLRIGTNRVLIEQQGQQKELTIFEGMGSDSLLPK